MCINEWDYFSGASQLSIAMTRYAAQTSIFNLFKTFFYCKYLRN